MGQITMCVWLLLALGVLFSATASAVAWAFVLMDPLGYNLPRSATGRCKRGT